jgi:tetratricopeptide (TPR) repeat protein
LDAAGALEEAKTPTALVIAREAAALAERSAESPARELELCEGLASHSLAIAALLCRLDDLAESLRQAERARSLYVWLRRAAPDVPDYGLGLSAAWERIAKARWSLGRRDEALAAFREAAAVQRQVVAQAPSVRLYRVALSRCYDRLAHWSRLAGDRAEAAAALLEREKLWPDDGDQLMAVARDFQRLADAVGRGREPLTPEEQAERRRYLAEAGRARQAAGHTSSQAGSERPTPTDAGPPQEATRQCTGPSP